MCGSKLDSNTPHPRTSRPLRLLPGSERPSSSPRRAHPQLKLLLTLNCPMTSTPHPRPENSPARPRRVICRPARGGVSNTVCLRACLGVSPYLSSSPLRERAWYPSWGTPGGGVAGEEGWQWGAPSQSWAQSSGSIAGRAHGRAPGPSTPRPQPADACARTALPESSSQCRARESSARSPDAHPLPRGDPAARHLLCPHRSSEFQWLRLERGRGLGRSEPATLTPPPRALRREDTEPKKGARAVRFPKAWGLGDPAPQCPPTPAPCSAPPTWLALWNCFFRPATDIAAAPGRVWVVSGLGRAAWPRRAGEAGARAGPRALGSAGPASHGHGHSHGLSRCHTRTHARTQLATSRIKAPAQPIGGAAAYANEAAGAAHAYCCVETGRTPSGGEDLPGKLSVARPGRSKRSHTALLAARKGRGTWLLDGSARGRQAPALWVSGTCA